VNIKQRGGSWWAVSLDRAAVHNGVVMSSQSVPVDSQRCGEIEIIPRHAWPAFGPSSRRGDWQRPWVESVDGEFLVPFGSVW